MTQVASCLEPHSWAARLLAGMTRGVVRFPRSVLALSLLTAVAGTYLAATQMQMRTGRLDLLNPSSRYTQLWMNHLKQFDHQDDVVVVVEGDQRAIAEAVVEELGRNLEARHEWFTQILYKVDLSQLAAKGVHYLPEQQWAGLQQFLAQSDPVLADDWSRFNLGKQLIQLAELASHARAAPPASPRAGSPEVGGALSLSPAMMQPLLQGLEAALEPSGDYASPWRDMDRLQDIHQQLRSRYLSSDDGRLHFIQLHLTHGSDNVPKNLAAMAELRRLRDESRRRYPQVKIGLTGLPVMESDEMETSQVDMTWATILSLAGVGVAFLAGFGGVRYPVAAVVTLLVALGWTVGYLVLIIGHLNLLSSAFGVILIGLGIDFGIHYVASYVEHLQETRDCATSLIAASTRVGPGLITGGATTAVAFAMFWLTPFTGIAELGIIAAGGIVFCVLAALVVLPALIRLADGDRSVETPIPAMLAVDGLVSALLRVPRLLILLTVGATVWCGVHASEIRYDHNLLNLQAADVESVAWERRLLENTEDSVWYAVSSSADLAELERRKEAFLTHESVQRVEELYSLIPPRNAQRDRAVAEWSQRLVQVPARPPVIPVASSDEVAAALTALQGMFAGQATDGMREQLVRLADRLVQMPQAEYFQRVTTYQQTMAQDLLRRLQSVRAISAPAPPSWHDLPPSLVRRFVGRDGFHLLRVYARGAIWDMQELERFVRDVKGVDPNATGQPLQTYYASREMLHSYFQTAIYSFIAVVALLVLDMGSLSLAALAMMPMLLGVTHMLGLIAWLDIPLNPANMIALPLLLGIGVDDGVHVVHDYFRQGAAYRMSRSTALSVVMTSVTTIVGFGSLMIAHHEGLRSLGRIMTIGMTTCLITSLFTLPALLKWWQRRQSLGATVHNDSPGPAIDGQLPPRRSKAASLPQTAGSGVPR